MSTNYYFNPSPTGKLKDFAPIHIGKYSSGGIFTFHGLNFEAVVPELPAVSIVSIQDWRELLLAPIGGKPVGTITDEYDREVNAEEFLKMMIRSKTMTDGTIRRCLQAFL